jgi:hypothetical protein
MRWLNNLRVAASPQMVEAQNGHWHWHWHRHTAGPAMLTLAEIIEEKKY